MFYFPLLHPPSSTGGSNINYAERKLSFYVLIADGKCLCILSFLNLVLRAVTVSLRLGGHKTSWSSQFKFFLEQLQANILRMRRIIVDQCVALNGSFPSLDVISHGQ